MYNLFRFESIYPPILLRHETLLLRFITLKICFKKKL